MRILHIVPTYVPAFRYGGPIYATHGLCKALAKRGHDVHVFTTNVDGGNDSDVPLGRPVDLDGVKIWYFPSKRMRRLYWSPPLRCALGEQARMFDLLHLHSIFLWPTWVAARAATRDNVPYIISPRGMLVKELINRKSRRVKSAWITLIERKNIERASGIHFTSKIEADEASRFGFKLPRIFIVPNGVDAGTKDKDDSESELSTQVMRILGNKPFLLFLSRINWKKGLDRLIPAMSYIAGIHLVIAGNDEEDYMPELETMAKEQGVRDRITFTGPVYGNAKTALLKHATALVLPSYSENFGNVVLEAMAAGCPVVVTPEVGVADIVQEYGAGMVVGGNPEVLGKHLRDLLSNPELLKEMGRQGEKAVREHFTWEAVAGRMEQCYCAIRSTRQERTCG